MIYLLSGYKQCQLYDFNKLLLKKIQIVKKPQNEKMLTLKICKYT